ncbi:AAHS family benzoate transporter-like MFS transporter [Brevibacterium sanguinis]|uniref:AAHS family benzoate transporter-like MFS transporter n=2 Tax=Brevibacterium TaxID=1696 RepID=A0A366IGM9_9MICO|nr:MULTISPECIES: MFS transporter [Brevibacterium]RBP62798.1 AAHS family benzoate transporter-like MFS transporter [Brevibacterium sanguinis]RBP69363.1 AAHS family benzoate transporter-like MFS transporter [Brevibacterium celere]
MNPKTTPTWVILLLCFLALLADGYDLYVYGATLPGFLGNPEWGVTKSLAGTVGSIALVGMLIGSLAAGTLTDRWGRRRLLLASLATFSIGMILCALAPDFTWFAVFRFLTCLGVGGVLPTAVALANEFAPKGKVSLSVGAVLLGPPVGSLVGALVASGIVVDHGVRPVYALGGLSLVLFAAVWFLLPESEVFLAARADRAVSASDAAASSGRLRSASVRSASVAPGTRSDQGISGLFATGRLLPTLLLWLVCLLSMLTMFGLTTWLPVIMQGAGFSTQSSITFLSVYSLGCIIGTIVIMIIAQRTAPKYMVVLGFTIAALALVLVSATQSPALLFVGIFFAGVGGMGTQNMINDHIAQFYPPRIRATGLGWALAIGRFGAIAGPVYGGLAATIGGSPNAAAVWFAVPAALGAIVAIIMPLRDRLTSGAAATPAPAGSTTPDRGPETEKEVRA